MIPSGWKRVGEPMVYWEVRDEALSYVSTCKDLEAARWIKRQVPTAKLKRITRHRLERTEVVETKGHGAWDRTLDGALLWGYVGACATVTRGSDAAYWANFGQNHFRFGMEGTAMHHVRKLLRDAGYRVVRAKEGKVNQ